MPDPQLPWYQDVRFLAPLGFGLWGAGLSTYQQVARLLDRRSKIKVFLGVGSSADGSNHFNLNIKNTGLVDAFLKPHCCMFEVKNEGFGISGKQTGGDLPLTLKPGDATSLQVSFESILTSVNQHRHHDKFGLRATVTDAVGRRASSEWVQMSDNRLVTKSIIMTWSAAEEPLLWDHGKQIRSKIINQKVRRWRH